MVKRPAVALVLASALLFAACSSGNGSQEDVPPSRPTERPEATRSGASITISPRGGPPGTEVTVSGSGWPGLAQVQITAAENPTNAPPYAQLTTAADGSFSARFRIDRAPDGGQLRVGPLGLVARAAGVQATASFQVESPRPVRGGGDGG
jgi:hypothetical protein